MFNIAWNGSYNNVACLYILVICENKMSDKKVSNDSTIAVVADTTVAGTATFVHVQVSHELSPQLASVFVSVFCFSIVDTLVSDIECILIATVGDFVGDINFVILFGIAVATVGDDFAFTTKITSFLGIDFDIVFFCEF